ncbi:MAG: SLATT domain-containing protein [Olegusella sp.]|nr:SLATT domain-containing protein [Olegusella sp.]
MGEDDANVMEHRLEEMLVGITWTHKIHEKQADIYESRDRRLTMASLLLTSVTASGIVGILFVDFFILKVISATFSLASIFFSLLAKTADYPSRAQAQRRAAKIFLGLREDTKMLLTDIHAKAIPLGELASSVNDLTTRYKDACMAAPSTTDKAEKRARTSLENGESMVTEAEKQRMVPGYKGGR